MKSEQEDKFGWGLIEYARTGLICKRTAKYEPKSNECICSEITFSEKKWVIFSIYRPPNAENLTDFFEEVTTSLTKVTSIYENIIVMGDFNIDTKCKGVGSNNLCNFGDLFYLTNIVKSDTCFTKTHTSLIDLHCVKSVQVRSFFWSVFFRIRTEYERYGEIRSISLIQSECGKIRTRNTPYLDTFHAMLILTIKPSSFNKTLVRETGLSDYHKMITTFCKLYFSRLRPKVITYRN